jgi:hypothetical protein
MYEVRRIPLCANNRSDVLVRTNRFLYSIDIWRVNIAGDGTMGTTEVRVFISAASALGRNLRRERVMSCSRSMIERASE